MLMQKILTVFDSALSAGHVVWTKTTLQRVSAAGIAFQVRLIPALAKKPVGDPAASKPAQQNGIEKPIDKRPAPVNPFLPYDPQLCVDVYEHHNLLLNKFSLVKGHVLLTTKGAGLVSESQVIGCFFWRGKIFEYDIDVAFFSIISCTRVL